MLVAQTMSAAATPAKLGSAGPQRSRTRVRPKPGAPDGGTPRRDPSPPPTPPTSSSSSAATRTTNDVAAATADDYRELYKLEDLELMTTLGTGTFGRVVLAKHRGSGEFFALKMLAISEVVRLKQVEHVKSEKAILTAVTHPFIVKMFWSDHNDHYLYMLLEYVCGGELFSYLRNAGRFNNAKSNFYAAEIVSALDYLHAKTIVYRDLKPENLLLDRDGHLKLTDFGFAKHLEDRTWTLCGTPEYLAPEIIQSKGHNKAVDWWALGVLIFEMLVGYPPFCDDNPFGIYEKILAGKIDWPKHMDLVAKDLVKKLLVQDRTKRLGNMKNGAEDIKRHKWFRMMDWNEVSKKKLKPPITPRVRHKGDARNYFAWSEPPIVPVISCAGDTQNFDEYPEDNWRSLTLAVSLRDAALFDDF